MKQVVIIILVLLIAQTVDAREDPDWIGPDSVLYPLKIWVEKFRLNFVFDHNEKVQGMLDLADERLREAENMENRSEEFKRASDEYTAQMEELQDFIEKNNINGSINTTQRNIVEATSSSGNSKIKVSVINGNASVYTEGNNATVIRDESGVTVVSVTNNSRQQVIVRSFQNNSSSSSVVVSSSSSVVSRNKKESD